MSRGSSDIVVTILRAWRPGFDSRRGRIFLYATSYKPALRPTQPLIQWVKGNAVPQHTYGGAGGEGMYSSYSFTTSALDGVSGQRHAPTALYSRRKDLLYPLYRKLGGPQSSSGHRG
jgi:hypothetical protein